MLKLAQIIAAAVTVCCILTVCTDASTADEDLLHPNHCRNITDNETCFNIKGCGWCVDSCYNSSIDSCCNPAANVETTPPCDGSPAAGVLCPANNASLQCTTLNYTQNSCMYWECCPEGQQLCVDTCYDPTQQQCCQSPSMQLAPLNATCCDGSYSEAAAFCEAGFFCCGYAYTICCKDGYGCGTNHWINTCTGTP